MINFMGCPDHLKASGVSDAPLYAAKISDGDTFDEKSVSAISLNSIVWKVQQI